MKIDIRQYGGLAMALVTLIVGIWLIIQLYEPIDIQNHPLDKVSFTNVGQVHSKMLKGELKTPQQQAIEIVGEQQAPIDGKQQHILEAKHIEARMIKGQLDYSIQPNITSLGVLTDSLHINQKNITRGKHVECDTCQGLIVGDQREVVSIGPWSRDCDLGYQEVTGLIRIEAQYIKADELGESFQNSIDKVDCLTDDISLGQQSIRQVSHLSFNEPLLKISGRKMIIPESGTYLFQGQSHTLESGHVILSIGKQSYDFELCPMFTYQSYVYEGCEIKLTGRDHITLKAFRLY